MKRHTIRVALPCPTCVHDGLCLVQAQIEQDVTLAVIDVGRPLELAFTCSWYEAAPMPASEPVGLAERRARSEHARSAARARWAKSDARMPDEHGPRSATA